MNRNDVRQVLVALLAGGIAAVCVPLLVLGGFVSFRVGGEYLARTGFDASQWQAAAYAAGTFQEDAPRIRMIDDLLDRHDLARMTRTEVTALLGEPDSGGTGRGENLLPGWDMAYHLGPERGILGLDSEWLAIRLDGSQNVREFKILVP